MAVLLSSCTSGRAVGPEPPGSPALGIAPIRVENVVSCPAGAPIQTRGRFFYPPTFPLADEPTAERCFESIAQARAAGLSWAPPPAGGRLIGGIYLVPVDLRASCATAARSLRIEVACPGILPAHSAIQSYPEKASNGWRDFAIESIFPGPPGYVGAANMSVPGKPIGHMWVESYRGPSLEAQCYDGRVVGHLSFRGRPARWIACPEAMANDGGHIVLQWTQGGIRYDVSIHGHTALNRRLAIAIGESVTFVR